MGVEVISSLAAIPQVYANNFSTINVYSSPVEGKDRVVETVYNVTIYDRGGNKQVLTNNHTVSYLV
jgi:hypothetical protein